MTVLTYRYAQPRYAQSGYAGGSAVPGGGGSTPGGTGAGGGLDLAGVLNYLAGVTTGPMLGPALAASAFWPAINGHGSLPACPTLTSTIGALNYKAGTTGQDIDLVCNTIAGTSGLEADLALRYYAGLP